MPELRRSVVEVVIAVRDGGSVVVEVGVVDGSVVTSAFGGCVVVSPAAELDACLVVSSEVIGSVVDNEELVGTTQPSMFTAA